MYIVPFHMSIDTGSMGADSGQARLPFTALMASTQRALGRRFRDFPTNSFPALDSHKPLTTITTPHSPLSTLHSTTSILSAADYEEDIAHHTARTPATTPPAHKQQLSYVNREPQNPRPVRGSG